MGNWLRVAALDELADGGITTRTVGGHVLAICRDGEQVHAVDNRCPHLGFPLDQGTVKDGILTCHWHHARFCTRSGGTFDPWADDVRAFPTELRADGLWVDLALSEDAKLRLAKRLQDGLERNIPLIIAKAVIQMLDSGLDPVAPFRIGLEFGLRYNRGGWGSGLTMLVCMMRLIPQLEEVDRTRALTHGLSAVAADCAGSPPRFPLDPLPADGGSATPMWQYRDWLRTFADTRDAAASERTVASAVQAGATPAELSAMLMDAATTHRYVNTGHVLDFINKAAEALDLVGWQELTTPTLGSQVGDLANASRAEESRSWQSPEDLAGMLERAFATIPDGLAEPRDPTWAGHDAIVDLTLGDDPAAIIDGLTAALAAGAPLARLARAVVHAAGQRIAQFHTSNEHSDWVRALHSFTFANAVHQGLVRSPDPALVRGIYDAAMTVFLNRFLNIPAARLPELLPTIRERTLGYPYCVLTEAGASCPRCAREFASADVGEADFVKCLCGLEFSIMPPGTPPYTGEIPADGDGAPPPDGTSHGAAHLAELRALYDSQQQVDRAGELTARYLRENSNPEPLIATLGAILVREDRDFHAIQMLEAAVTQARHSEPLDPLARVMLIAAARYMAAHFPTRRAQNQRHRTAWRLHKGDALYNESNEE